MNYIKKMCILRQLKQGFSADGKALSGLIKIEQYGKNVAIEVSVINFAPLISGEYYCVIADSNHRTEMLPLRGKSFFNILSDMDISQGFCGVICFIKNEIVPIAYGVNGNREYDWKKILNATLPPSFLQKPKNNEPEKPQTAISETFEKSIEKVAQTSEEPREKQVENCYNDEEVATKDYYKEQTDEQGNLPKNHGDEPNENQTQEKDQKGNDDLTKNEDSQNVRHPFTTDSDGYYLAVKREIDELFSEYPPDDTLRGAFSCSEWVRVKGEKENPEYLVGVVYDDGRARYICYALAAKDKTSPPSEIAQVCTFVPNSPLDDQKGFFVIFQSAATGECIQPQRL